MNTPSTTKHRLLKAACTVFAEKGFRDATVAEICDTAGANIAAVNYYFGDKSNLYYACFMHLFEVARKTYPQPDPQTAVPDEWLRIFARSRVLNILDEGEAGLLPRLMFREMGQPSEIHRKITEELIMPRRRVVVEMIRRFLGEPADEQALSLAVANFISTHIHINIDRNLSCAVGTPRPSIPTPEMDRNTMADQAAGFAMGGLRATREFLNDRKNKS